MAYWAAAALSTIGGSMSTEANKLDTYLDFFEGAPLACLLIDGQGLVLHANRSAQDLIGPVDGNIIGKNIEQYFIHGEESVKIIAAFATGKPFKAAQAILLTASGQELPVLISSSGSFDGDSLRYNRLVIQNVSDLVIVDRPTQLKNDVLKILVESSTTNEAMCKLVPTIAQALDSDVGLVWRADEKANRLDRLVLWRAETEAGVDHFLCKSNNISLEISSGFPAEHWFSGRARKIVVDKSSQCCGAPMTLSLPEYKQIVSVPIAIGRLNWGLFGFFAQVEREVSPAYLALLESLGSLIGQFIERQEALKNYQKMQESYALAIAGANEGIWDWDFTTNEVFFSPKWKSLLGFEDHELENHFDTFRTLTHPDDYPRVMDAVQSHMETRVPYEEEFRMRTKSGDYVWICARGHCSYNALGQAVRMSGSHRDISKIKEAELAKQRSEANLRESSCKSSAATSSAEGSTNKPLVMLLEDSDSTAILLKGLLQKKGYAAVRAATIAEAKDLLKTTSVDFIIADINLPDGSGVSFVKWLQDKGTRHKNVPLILLSTAEADLTDIRRPALVDTMLKPFDTDKLISLIKARLDNVQEAKI